MDDYTYIVTLMNVSEWRFVVFAIGMMKKMNEKLFLTIASFFFFWLGNFFEIVGGAKMKRERVFS
jgi:hypothetical protein